MFPTVLDYFKECKGQVRQVLVEKAMKIITSAEEETNEHDKEVILNSTAYKRAREILQILPYDKVNDQLLKISKNFTAIPPQQGSDDDM